MNEVHPNKRSEICSLGEFVHEFAAVDEIHVSIELGLQLGQVIRLVIPSQLVGHTKSHAAVLAAYEVDDVAFVNRHAKRYSVP